MAAGEAAATADLRQKASVPLMLGVPFMLGVCLVLVCP